MMTDYTYTGSIQTEEITVSGTYSIVAFGAAGGSAGSNAGGTGGPGITSTHTGGPGAMVSGDIFLAAGTVLEIVVGGEGSFSTYGGGGGGGSFVIETNNGTSAVDIVLAVAGGGGGGGDGFQGHGANGNTTTAGYSGGTGGGAGGVNGAGGGASFDDGGGGGGGINGNGGNSDSAKGGQGQSAGFAGGNGDIGGTGGFGGGGGGGRHGGGGGGGYGGGGGGGNNYAAGLTTNPNGGGGGGSYDSDLTEAFASTNQHTGNGDVTINAICYLRGTRILTPTGPAPVESLKIGDTVVTRFGGIRPIKWIGRQSFSPHFIATEKCPIHISAGALGDQFPARDLYVSPGHSMLLNGVLVLASRLVNGITITQTSPTEDVAYFQMDLGTHDCILAEGAWSETYADAPGQRAQFHNAAEFDALYPNDPPPEDLTLCAPRPESGPRLEAALRLLPDTSRMGGAQRAAQA
jgi:hypothetical protein